MSIQRVSSPRADAFADAVRVTEVTAELAGALRHPVRVAVLLQLTEQQRSSPKELATTFDQSLGVVSYHVRLLAGKKFLKPAGKIQRRGAIEHRYTLSRKGQDAAKTALFLAGLDKKRAIDER